MIEVPITHADGTKAVVRIEASYGAARVREERVVHLSAQPEPVVALATPPLALAILLLVRLAVRWGWL